jgi:hypothetical protein
VKVKIVINEYTPMVLDTIMEFDKFKDKYFIETKEAYNIKTGELYKFFTVDVNGFTIVLYRILRLYSYKEFLEILQTVVPQVMVDGQEIILRELED